MRLTSAQRLVVAGMLVDRHSIPFRQAVMYADSVADALEEQDRAEFEAGFNGDMGRIG